MLREFIEKELYCFHDHFDTWQAAIKASCQPLENKRICDSSYADAIITCVEKYGPYIIIMPNVALPHAQEGATGVMDTAISFMKVNKPVSFDPNDSESDALLFFVLASVDHDQHLDNMARLSTLLMNEALVEELYQIQSLEELKALAEKYEPQGC